MELGGRPVGRVWISQSEDALLVVDMAFLPGHRSAGIGTMLLEEVFAEADRGRVPVRLTSTKANPRALALCERLGFSVVSDDGLFVMLERGPR